MPSKVLMVDDDPLMHLLYRTHLEKAGYEMVTAKDGSEVVEIASREQPKLIFMDVMMEPLDGLAALRELKRTPATKNIPVIVITAIVSVHEAVRQESALSGAADFLGKPFSPAKFMAQVKKYVPEP